MIGRIRVTLMGCLAMVSTLMAAGPYDWPGNVDMEGLSSRPRSRADIWREATEGALKDWQALWSPEFATPLFAYGSPLLLVSPQAGEETRVTEAHAFLLQMACLFGETTLDLDMVKAGSVRGKWKALFQEKRDGRPVLGSRADITLNARGEVMRWGLRSYSTWPELSTASLSLNGASERLRQKIGRLDWPVSESESFAAFFPDFTLRGLRPVWWVRLIGAEPDARWEGIVDATTGEVVLDWSGIQSDEVSGFIEGQFWYPYNSSPTDTGAYTRETIFINANEVVSDLDGYFAREVSGTASLTAWLRGPYVEVINDDAPASHLDLELSPPFTPFVWTWTTEDATREEMNAFYHTRFIHQWYKEIDPSFTDLDYAMPVYVNYGSNYENAFWNGWGCYYGSGGATYDNFVMYCDVIYHEYTHGVTGRIYQGISFPYDGQPGAMNEAWSDYILCTITDEPLVGEGGLTRGNPLRYFRNLDNDMHFPEDWQGEVHRDSPFISGALWRIRSALGPIIADSLAHFSRYGHATNFLEYLVEVLETDDDDGNLSNGTPHDEVIYASFGHHGIGPGLEPNLVLQNVRWVENGEGGSMGDGDGWPEAGERVEMTFSVCNDVILFPPPAMNVQLNVLCDDPDLTVTGGQQNLGDLGPGQVVTPQPILIDIASSVRDHWTGVTLSLSAENTTEVFDQDISFTVGRPRVLLVKDDPTSDVEEFVDKALRGIDVIFDQIELAQQENLPDSVLPEPGLVLWLSGNARQGILTSNDQYLLTDYLNRGNRVVLSGQDIMDDLSGGPFAQNVLEMEVVQDSLRATSVRPIQGSPLIPENWFLLVGSAGAANQVRMSVLRSLGNNQTICGYGRQGTQGLAGLDFREGRGIVFGFGIEAISGMDTSESLGIFLSELFYRWAPDILPTDYPAKATPLPTTVVLGPAFPNPFNAVVNLPYVIPTGKKAELIIFDILGREMSRFQLERGNGTIAWNAQATSGIYFAQLRWETGASPVAKLILLR
ncbi:MAG: T9SS type A sorting domain-containing protein [bacterium]